MGNSTIPGLIPALITLLAFTLPAQEPNQGKKRPTKAKVSPAAAQIIKTHQKARYNPGEKGLHSFLMRLTLHMNKSLRCEALYSWKKPDAEEILLTGNQKQQRAQGKIVKKSLNNFYKALIGNNPLSAKNLKGCSLDLAENGPIGPKIIEARRGKNLVARLSFDRVTGLLKKNEDLTRRKVTIEYTWTKVKGIMLLAKQTVKQSRNSYSFSYSSYRQYSGFFLPSRVVIDRENGKMDFHILVEQINGTKAKAAKLDPAFVKEQIAEFKRGWNRLDQFEKVKRVRELAEIGCPEVAKVLARFLNDKSKSVILEIINSLGRLGEKVITPKLCSMLGKAEKDAEISAALCRALGDIGDPRAVDPLIKGIFSGDRRSEAYQDRAKERIDALSAIKDHKTVDELVSLLGKSGRGGGRRIRGRGKGGGLTGFQRSIASALTKLTGQELNSFTDWRNWWKANRRKFKF